MANPNQMLDGVNRCSRTENSRGARWPVWEQYGLVMLFALPHHTHKVFGLVTEPSQNCFCSGKVA